MSGIAKTGGLAVGTALVGGLVASVHAAMESQASVAALNQALKNTHQSVTAMTPVLDKATAAARKLGFGNIDARAALAKLETATGNTKKAISELSIAEDISRLKHVALSTASQMLAQAQTGSQRAIKQLGLSVPPVTAHLDALKASNVDLTTVSGRLAEAHARLLDKMATGSAVIALVRDKVKGQAQAFADSAAGGMAQFHAQLGNIEEAVGNKLLPILTSAVQWVTSEWPKISATITPVMHDVGTVIREVLSNVSTIWNKWGGDIERVLNIVVTLVRDQLKILGDIFRVFGDMLKGNWGAVWSDIKRLAVDAVKLAVDEIKGLGGLLLDAGRAIGTSLVHGITAGLSMLGSALVAGILYPINAAIRAIDAFHLPAVGFSIFGQHFGFGGWGGFQIPEIPMPKLDVGGYVAQTGMAVVHRGETYSGVGRSLGGPTINVTVNGWVGNDQQIAERIRRELIRTGRREVNIFGGLA